MNAFRAPLLAVLASPAIAAAALHDALRPAGPQAAHIAQLWWIIVAACAFVFVAIMVALALALHRAPRARDGDPGEPRPDAARERRIARPVIAAVALSAMLLVGLLAASIMTDRALARLPLQGAVNIRVTAHQWWWDVLYDDAQPERIFRTANEIHVPVGRPVIATLAADDVIHSFWVPSLHGKKDLIPGRPNVIEFRADEPGTYRGFCAEYCGVEHAFMSFDVIAMPPQEFDAWAQRQREPAPEPANETTKHGRDLFLSGSCMLCHAVAGTTAQARKAPDLTHVASRTRLAAGSVRNTPQELAAWITDPQAIKPGANMPAHPLPPEDLQALVAYLETLK